MIIKNGFNDKETEIRLCVSGGHIELWIRQSGVSDKETLSYLTPDELLCLYREVKEAGKGLFN